MSWDQLYFMCAEALEHEHARALKLVSAAERAIEFGFVITQVNGVLRNTRTDLQIALAEWHKK